MNETILTINYRSFTQSNRGQFSIILEKFMPCSVSDFSKVLEMVAMDPEQEKHAATLDDFIKKAVEDLKTTRAAQNEKSEKGKKTRRECTAKIKKYIALSEKLAQRFGTEAATEDDDNKQIKSTPATVHALRRSRRFSGSEIVTYHGWTFKKAGYTFQLYHGTDRPDEYITEKDYPTGRGYCVLLAGTGVSVATASNRATAPGEITAEIIELLKNKDLKFYFDQFNKYMSAAGYEMTEEEKEEQEARQEEKKTTGNQEQKTEEQEKKTENQEQKKEVTNMGLNTRYFSNARNLEDVKRLFKQYARELHPDNGGDAEEFKNMMSDYRAAFNRAKEGLPPEQAAAVETPEEFADVINAVINLDGVNIEICGAWVWISGNTYPVKDTLKAAGYRFASRKKMWYYHADGWRKHGKTCDMDKIRELHGSISVTSHGPGFRIGAAV